MRPASDDRRWAAGLAVAGVAAGLAAIRFRVAFITDPLGPRAFPWLAAGLLVAGAVGLALRPGSDAAWPEGPARRRVAWVVVGLVAWSVVMPILGFVPATTVLLAGLGRLFGAGVRGGLAAGLGVSTLLWALFGWGLGLPLPPGPWG